MALARAVTPAVVPDAPLSSYLMTIDPKMSPVAALLERRSDWSFIEAMLEEVGDFGLDEAAACQIVGTVLGHPSLVMATRVPSPVAHEVFAAVALEPAVEGLVNLVTVGLTVDRSVKPAEVTSYELSLDAVDLESPKGLAALASRVEQEQERLGVPRIGGRPPGEIGSITWIGNPAHAAVREVPPHWASLIRSAGIVHGIEVHVADTPKQFAAKNWAERTDAVCLPSGLDMSRWGTPESQTDWISVGIPGSAFVEVLDALREMIISLRIAVRGDSRHERQDLAPGQRVYHRKIGGNDKPFDTFDDGSPDACIHGADGYRRWTKAPKALKGMQRRYNNIGPRNLFHCDKYPSCGVYMIEGS
jgi:hypothetical protein